MRKRVLSSLAALTLGSSASAATLTITPDQVVYHVGDTITLTVSGDAEGASAYSIYGRMLFDADRADYVASHQERLTSRGSPWLIFQLTGGNGFGEAFSQGTEIQESPDGPLSASVTLLATAPGILHYSWLTDGDPDFRLRSSGSPRRRTAVC